jgi:hypothetical protein
VSIKVGGPNGPSSTQAPKKAAKSAGGFLVPASSAAQSSAPSAPAAGVANVGSVDALIALQAAGSPLERKRRAVRRAGRILDVLDEIKIGLLDGTLSHLDLSRLVNAVKAEREGTDDPRLEGVLDEIETRAAVELAKLETMRDAA